MTTRLIFNGEVHVIEGNCSNVTIRNGVITVNGRHLDVKRPSETTLKIQVEGDLINLTTDADVECRHVRGNVNAGGKVSCDDVDGSVNAGSSVDCCDIHGDASAGNVINCRDIQGNVQAMSITHHD